VRSQVVVQPRQQHPLDPGHPVQYPGGEVDRGGRDEGESAYARAHVRAPVVVASLVEVGGDVRAQAKDAEPTRAPCPLWCADRSREESQTRRGHG
jgi:hypothetical protein